MGDRLPMVSQIMGDRLPMIWAMGLRRTWGIRLGSLVQRAVGDEGFAGGLFEDDLARAEQAVDIVAAFERDEEELARAGSPLGEQIGGRKEEGLRVGEGRAEEHGGRAAVDQKRGARERAVEVEGDGRAVGLVAVEQKRVVARDLAGGFELLDAVGRGLGG